MYFGTYNSERYFVFFGAVSKCEDISLVPQSATSPTISLKLWLYAQFFLIIKNIILKKHFKIKWWFWRLVSPDCKDALNAICQTLTFLLDISLKHCLFITDNLWRFKFKWSENLAEGYSPNFPGLWTKALLPAFPWENEQHILQSHPFSTEEKEKPGKCISYDTSLDSLLFFTSGLQKIVLCLAVIRWQYQCYLKYQNLVH